MNGQAEDHSPLAKVITELESIKGRRYPLAWAQLHRLTTVNTIAIEMAKEMERILEILQRIDCPVDPELIQLCSDTSKALRETGTAL